MEIIDGAALKVQLPADLKSRLLGHVKDSVPLSDGTVLTKWDHYESTFLARLLDSKQPYSKLPDVPSPMLRDYDWPGIFNPFSHQQHTASYLSIRQRAYCFSEMGTGKTSAAIWAADYLINTGIVKRVLVVCPLSVMYTAWQADIFKTAMHRSVGIAYGSRERRLKVIKSDFDFVIINYDGVGVVKDEINRQRFDLIIVDEANAYKNTSTKRWKTLAKLLTPDTWLWMMTGTPASQSPVDAFGLARMVDPERVPKFVTAWRDRVMYQATRFKWVPRKDSKNHVFRALQPAIRYTKDECVDLPDIVYTTREVPLTVQVSMYYKELKKEMMIEAAGAQVSAVNAAAQLSKLLQISGGAVYTDQHDTILFDVEPRLHALREVLDETSNKVVVFVPYLHTIKVVSEYLSDIGVHNEIICGDVSAKARAEIINRFQTVDTGLLKALVVQPQSASHGVTLTAADTVVFWSPVTSVETYLQCVGRINRVGQKNKMTVVRLQGSDAERKVYQMLQAKIDGHIELVELYKSIIEE